MQEKKQEAKPKVNEYKLKKEAQSNLRKLKTKLSRLESDIEDLEDEIGLLTSSSIIIRLMRNI